MTLDDALQNRANNFTVIRLVLAWSVLYGHSYAITNIPGVHEPLSVFLKSTLLVELAVNGFFAISGLLIAKSFIDRGVINYTVSRLLRIFPALLVCIPVTALVLGAAVTSLSVIDYYSHTDTWSYLENAMLPKHMQFYLPGVYESNPRSGVNGSLWTLPVEVRCYALLAILGLLGMFRNTLVMALVAALLLYVGFTDWNSIPMMLNHPEWARVSAFFLIGAMAYQLRRDIPIAWPLFFLSCTVIFLARGWENFDYIVALPWIYILYFCAFGLPHFDLDRRLGDISYGVYIYAFPIQQLLKEMFPDSGPTFNWIVATPIVFALAYASWRMVEKPSLNKKKPVMEAITNLTKIS